MHVWGKWHTPKLKTLKKKIACILYLLYSLEILFWKFWGIVVSFQWGVPRASFRAVFCMFWCFALSYFIYCSNPRWFFWSHLMALKSVYLQRSHWDKLRTVFLFLIAIKLKKLWQFQFVNFRPIFRFFPLFRATICRSRRRNRRDHEHHLFYCHFLIFHPILMKFGTLTEKVKFFSFLVKYSVYLYCNTY